MLTFPDSVIAAAEENPDSLLTDGQLARLMAEHGVEVSEYLPDCYHPSWRNTFYCPHHVLEYLGY